ncbi:DUF4830 domain-containing protein [uncultured Eubacterium sp.]|uniref:DUF4830 domain-containing protein n=1 Tax=uncultured Eubacterium sp. TaxID=165185 RepID=UPI0015AA3AA7|nr:DUF4830 domain-containing protein [uncultured Eubacterium sp.]
MRMFTFKMKPKQIFGLILLLTGLVVVLITFLSNHPAKPASKNVSIRCATTQERVNYINSFDLQTDSKEESKEIIIPEQFNDVYNKYNDIQKQQNFDLTDYKGKTAVMYTYNITNYQDNDNVIANLIVYDGILIGADLCDTSADNGFLVALNDKTRQNNS